MHFLNDYSSRISFNSCSYTLEALDAGLLFAKSTVTGDSKRDIAVLDFALWIIASSRELTVLSLIRQGGSLLGPGDSTGSRLSFPFFSSCRNSKSRLLQIARDGRAPNGRPEGLICDLEDDDSSSSSIFGSR